MQPDCSASIHSIHRPTLPRPPSFNVALLHQPRQGRQDIAQGVSPGIRLDKILGAPAGATPRYPAVCRPDGALGGTSRQTQGWRPGLFPSAPFGANRNAQYQIAQARDGEKLHSVRRRASVTLIASASPRNMHNACNGGSPNGGMTHANKNPASSIDQRGVLSFRGFEFSRF